MSNAPTPAVIDRYLAAHDARDTDSALSAFTPDATVIDDGHEYHGNDEIRGWLATAAAEYTFTRTDTGSERLDASTWLIHNRLEGDFPGGVADLTFRFTLTDDRIAELVIAP